MDKQQFLINLAASDRSDIGRVEFRDQSGPQRIFSTIWELESYLSSGGFLDFFCYSGEAASFAPTALRSVGAQACADIVERALRALSTESLPDTATARERLVDSLDDDIRAAFDDLDAEFYEYPDDLTELLFAYVASQPAVFGEVPTG